ncbi:MAG: serine acetyltransferase [Sandaracinaceae bacterium]|nr:serine acetyltransferase [Sandaracinaceae bacterium]
MEEVTLRGTLDAIREDARAYHDWRREAGFWVTLSYRVRRQRKHGGAGSRLLLGADLLLGGVRRLVSDTRLPADAEIGPGLCLPHPTGVVLNDRVRIGRGVAIFQQVTLGEWKGDTPEVEDGAALFAGAKVIGGVRVGAGAMVGANAVVHRDVPAGATVAAPAGVVRERT